MDAEPLDGGAPSPGNETQNGKFDSGNFPPAQFSSLEMPTLKLEHLDSTVSTFTNLTDATQVFGDGCSVTEDAPMSTTSRPTTSKNPNLPSNDDDNLSVISNSAMTLNMNDVPTVSQLNTPHDTPRLTPAESVTEPEQVQDSLNILERIDEVSDREVDAMDESSKKPADGAAGLVDG